jgi:hypothetical protein
MLVVGPLVREHLVFKSEGDFPFGLVTKNNANPGTDRSDYFSE